MNSLVPSPRASTPSGETKAAWDARQHAQPWLARVCEKECVRSVCLGDAHGSPIVARALAPLIGLAPGAPFHPFCPEQTMN